MGINTRAFIETYLQIKNKKADIIPFRLNKPQQKLYDVLRKQYLAGKPQRVIILKARQMGFSTLTEAILFKTAITTQNVKCCIVAHKEESTKSLFEMNRLFYERLPGDMRVDTRASNAYELSFDTREGNGLRSSIVCRTAGGKGIGRGDTYQMLHASEYAFWPEGKKDIMAGLLQAVPNEPDTMVVIESTAHGYDDFKDKWDKATDGLNDFIPVFFAWFEMDEYYMKPKDLDIPLTFGRYGNEEAIKRLYSLSDGQLQWRRWCIDNNCDGDLDIFKQEYPSNPEEAFLSTGNSVFNTEIVVEQIERSRRIKPLHVGYFEYSLIDENAQNKRIEDIRWVDDERGYIALYAEPEVKRNEDGIIIARKPYAIGGDTAGVGDDFFAAKVIDNVEKRTVARLWKQRLDDDLYSAQVYCLGRHYNDALIGIETNFSTYPNRLLEMLNYPRLYRRERMDTLTNKIEMAVGFETNVKTKPVIIQSLVALMRDFPESEIDVPTLKEMLTFIRDENGRYHAVEGEGKHDDLVMATAIAHFVAWQQSSIWIEYKAPETGFIRKNFKVAKPSSGGDLW